MDRKSKINQKKREMHVRQLAARNMDAPSLPPSIAEQLKEIAPQNIRTGDKKTSVYPCSVTLNDGRVQQCTYLMSVLAAKRWWWIKTDSKHQIQVQNIVSISPSPYRLQESLANKILEAGETGMGYTSGVFQFKNGKTLPWVTTESMEFMGLPDEYSIHDIIDIKLHIKNEEGKELIRPKSYVVALFREENIT